jgi:hypothetical protein
MRHDLTDTILTCISKGRYSTDNGETFFQGQSLSALVDDLRDRGYKISSPYVFADRLRELGFKVITARPKMTMHHTSDNPKACRAPCQCVTV